MPSQGFENVSEDLDLLRGEGVDEMVADAHHVLWGNLFQQTSTTRCEDSQGGTTILGTRFAVHCTHAHETIEASSQSTGREVQQTGKVAHPHALVFLLTQVHKNLIIADREADVGEIALESVLQITNGLDVSTPRSHLAGIEPFDFSSLGSSP